MKLGFITAICEGMRFEEVVDFAASMQPPDIPDGSLPQSQQPLQNAFPHISL